MALVILQFMSYFASNYEPYMRSFLSERNIVVVLFVLVLVTFSLAHEDTKKMEQIYQISTSPTAESANPSIDKNEKTEGKEIILPAVYKQ